MPSKFNSEFNYRYQVLGNTPWAKIKILRGFLEGRIRAASGEEASYLQHDARIEELAYLKRENAPRHQLMRAEADILESTSHMAIVDEAYQLNCKEVEILNKLLAELYEIAEPTRIPGYSDEDMFEVNEANEFTATTLREMQSEIIALGRPTPATVLHAMNNPHTLHAAVQSGMLPVEALPLLTSNPPIFAAQEMAALNTIQEGRLMAEERVNGEEVEDGEEEAAEEVAVEDVAEEASEDEGNEEEAAEEESE